MCESSGNLTGCWLWLCDSEGCQSPQRGCQGGFLPLRRGLGLSTACVAYGKLPPMHPETLASLLGCHGAAHWKHKLQDPKGRWVLLGAFTRATIFRVTLP